MALPCFISGTGWVPKLKILEIPMGGIHADLLAEGLAELQLSRGSSQKSEVRPHSGLEFMARHSRKPAKTHCFSQRLCSYASQWGSSLAPSGSFAPGEVTATPLPNVLQAGKLAFHMRPRGSSDLTAHSWVSAFLPHWSTAKTQA